MSVQDDLKALGIKLTADQKRAIRQKVFQLKIQRALLEKQMKAVAKGKQGKLSKEERRYIAFAMQKRSKFNMRIFRFGGEKRAPEFDPY